LARNCLRDASGIGPAEFARHIEGEIKLWEGVIKASNVKLGE
jgi:hypothetical protein